VELLVLGNSHTYNGIDPELLDWNAFSLANMAQGYDYDYYLLTHYSILCPKLKCVILPVSYPGSFFRPSLDKTNWSSAANYYIYMGKNDRWFTKYHFELCRPYVLHGKIESWKKGEVMDCSPLGYGQRNSMPDQKIDLQTALERLAYIADKGHEEENYAYNLDWLVHSLEYCKRHSYQVILVTMPVHHLFYENINPREMDMITQTVHELSTKYSFVYIDYLKDSRFGEQDFVNVDHLNNVGAEKFTKILNMDIHRLLDNKYLVLW
jgi:hypothetical protein